MTLQDFLGKLVLPFGVFLQILGYAESVHKFFGLPEPFLIASSGFLLTIACLVWLVWFSGRRVAEATKGISLGALIAVSVAYFVLVQYEVVSEVERKVISVGAEIESARSLVTSDANSAVERMNQVIEKIPDVAELYNIRGVALNNTSRFRDALNDFKKAAALDSTNRQYEFNIAVAERAMCDYKGAKQLLDGYIVRYQSDMQGRYNHGVVEQILDDQDDALSEYNIVIQSKTEPTEAALFNSAVIYAAKTQKVADQQGLVAKVTNYLGRALKLNPYARLQKIKAALVPLEQREPRCDRYYATDDLTPVASHPQFVDWLRHAEM
jgi:tetratricopeptide (TPR) repeat protein